MQSQNFQGMVNNGLKYVEIERLCMNIPFVNQKLSLK